MTSVFDFLPPTEQVSARFFTHKSIGDSIEGTYVGRIDGVMNNYGNLQTIITICNVKSKRVNEMGMPVPSPEGDPQDGDFAKVGISSSKVTMLSELDKCKFGDIIGLIFTSMGRQIPGKQQSKIVRIAHKDGLVDEEWIKEQQGLKPVIAQTTAPAPTPVVTDYAPTPAPDLAAQLGVPFVTDTDKINRISTLVIQKFGPLSAEQVKEKVLETTGLAFLPVNLDLILQRLQ